MKDRYETFTVSISRIYRSIQKIKQLETEEFGLKGAFVSCIFFLSKHPEGLTSTQLTLLCDEDRAAISRSVSDLEERGLLFCEQKSGKRYRSRLFLTEEGKAIAARIDEKIDHAVCIGGQGLTEEEREEFYRILHIIAANLSGICKDK